MKALIFGLLSFLAVSCVSIDAQSRTTEDRALLQSIGIQIAGNEIIIDSYCITEVEDDAFIQLFIAALQEGGMGAYVQMLNSPRLPCWDARMHQNVSAVKVILLKKIKDIRILNGEELTFWMVEDTKTGLIGYTWLKTEGQNI